MCHRPFRKADIHPGNTLLLLNLYSSWDKNIWQNITPRWCWSSLRTFSLMFSNPLLPSRPGTYQNAWFTREQRGWSLPRAESQPRSYLWRSGDRGNGKPHFPLAGKALECNTEILCSFSFAKRAPEGPERNDLLQQCRKPEDDTQILMIYQVSVISVTQFWGWKECLMQWRCWSFPSFPNLMMPT